MLMTRDTSTSKRNLYPLLGYDANTHVVTSSTLDAANSYLVEARGVYYAGGNFTFDLRADAEYSQDAVQRASDPATNWTDDVRGYLSYGEALLELKVDGAFIEWGAYNPAHIYTLEKPGTGRTLTLQFQVNDVYAQNNTGGLAHPVQVRQRSACCKPWRTLPRCSEYRHRI